MPAVELFQQVLTRRHELVFMGELAASQQFCLVQVRSDTGRVPADFRMAGLRIDKYRNAAFARDQNHLAAQLSGGRAFQIVRNDQRTQLAGVPLEAADQGAQSPGRKRGWLLKIETNQLMLASHNTQLAGRRPAAFPHERAAGYSS